MLSSRVDTAFGSVESVAHDYKRDVTTKLFAALNVPNGALRATCKPRRRKHEFLSFLREIDDAFPLELDSYCGRDGQHLATRPLTRRSRSRTPSRARLAGC